MSILSIILVFGLFISAYIMGIIFIVLTINYLQIIYIYFFLFNYFIIIGTRSFIKANMSFGSIFVVLSGIALGGIIK